MALDKVFIEQLEVITTIGVYDWEQQIKQKLVLDIEMAHDNRIRLAKPGAVPQARAVGVVIERGQA